MPTPPFTIPVPAPVAPIATPALTLPCGVKIPSIPIIPNLSFSIPVPSINLFPTKAQKQGTKPARKKGKTAAQKVQELATLCSETVSTP